MSKTAVAQAEQDAVVHSRPLPGEKKTFLIKVKHSGEEFKQPGVDAAEALALFNDGRQQWPSPKMFEVTEFTAEMKAAEKAARPKEAAPEPAKSPIKKPNK